jgi:tripartite-type tricarboxylate transporter receptor subunit TctC
MCYLRKVTLAVIAGTLLGIGGFPGCAQAQQNFPTRPIRLVLPFPAGQDALARQFGAKLAESWVQPVVIDNRPSGGGTLAGSTVANAPPDGHTLLWTSAAFGMSAALYGDKLPYDPLRDFTGVAQIALGTAVLVVTPSLGVKSVPELIALAKAKPGTIYFGSGGAGTGTHINAERFRFASGINTVHVAFKGTQALIETAAGRVHYCIFPVGQAMPLIKQGKLLALAVNTPERSPLLPDLPTVAESVPNFEREGSYALLAPARTPRSIVHRISREAARILGRPELREWMQTQGFVPAPTTPEEYDRILRAQIESHSRFVKLAGLRAQ